MPTAIRCAAFTAALLLLKFPAAAEEPARIYVYAQRLTAARSWIRISSNGAVVAELKRGTFFAINAAPGRYTLSVENGLPAFVDVAAGGEVFVRLDWNMSVDRPPIPVLSTVPAAQARKEMENLSYISANRIVSASVAKRDPTPARPLRLQTRDPH